MYLSNTHALEYMATVKPTRHAIDQYNNPLPVSPLFSFHCQPHPLNSPNKSVQAELALRRDELVRLVLADQLFGARWICVRMQDLVEPGVTLRLVEKVHQLRGGHQAAFRVASSVECEEDGEKERDSGRAS